MKRKHVLLAGALLIAGVVLFPPFMFHGVNGMILNCGFTFIGDPPLLMGKYHATVNAYLLALEMLAVIGVTTAGYLAAKD